MSARLDRSPNASLRRVGTSTRACVDRIVATYALATEQDRHDGAAWYADAESVATDLAYAGDVTLPHAAAVIAHLSPRTSWTRNVSGAWSLITQGYAIGCLGSNVARARVALKSSDPLGTINGPKTRAFAANILGDRDAVTIDVWAARTALGRFDGVEHTLGRVGVYDALAHAYRLAAARLGTDPTTVQATCWIVERGRSGWAEANAALEEIASGYDAIAPTESELAAAGW